MLYEIQRTTEFDLWLGGLRDRQAVRAIDKRIARLRLGHFGDCKNLGGELYELRVFLGPGYRLYCSIRKDVIVLLLLGGDKSTQSRDIAKARALLGALRDKPTENDDDEHGDETLQLL